MICGGSIQEKGTVNYSKDLLISQIVDLLQVLKLY